MIDLSVSKWLPDDKELTNFYKGVDDFVLKHVHFSKKFNKNKVIIDPCVGYIEIYPWEITLIDTHIFQQLRKITQLGLAYLVFPTLRYSRFEHTLGVLGRLNQMLKKLRDKHRDDSDITSVIDNYETTLRLAALFHDIGHCLFSHLGESVINKLQGNEIADINSDEYYPSVKTIKEKFNTAFKTNKSSGLSVAEIFSITMMSSNVFTELLFKAGFHEKIVGSKKSSVSIEEIPGVIGNAVKFIAGIPEFNNPKTIFLAQLISSGLDADKLDYMSREEHFSGIKVEMDLERILNKIKIQKVTSKRELQKGLEKYAKHIKDSMEPYYILCIEKGGQFAYEEFCVARLALYEKIYLHKKVRAAEQSLKNQLEKIPYEINEFNYAHNWLYLPECIVESETTIIVTKTMVNIDLFGSKLSDGKVNTISKKLNINLSFIEKREIPHRVFAFGPANATYDSDYYRLLDSAKTNDDIEKEIKTMLSVRFWDLIKTKEGHDNFIEKLKNEVLSLIEFLITNSIKVNNYETNDLKELKADIENNSFSDNLIIDVPDYSRVVLSFETLHFEESSFQSIRWTIPIHRISHYYQLHRILAYIFYDKKHLDIICLACEKVILDFISNTEDERQVYEQKNYISIDTYTAVHRLKALIIKKNPSYYKGYEELLPINEKLDNEHTTDIINKIVQELNRYHSHKFTNDIKHQNVLNYLRQFDEDIQSFVLEILSSIKVLHESELEPLFETTFNEIKDKYPNDKINVIPLGTSFSSAAGMMKYFRPLLTKYNIGNETLENPDMKNFNHFVFFDDNTNSGRQALNIIARLCGMKDDELREKKVYTNINKNGDAKFINKEVADKLKCESTKITLCFMTGTDQAKEFLEKNLKEICKIMGEIKVKIKYRMTTESGLFNDKEPLDDGNIFNKIKREFLPVKGNYIEKTVSKAKKALIDVGEQLVKQKEICSTPDEQPSSHALGYCNRESTVIFYNSVPTSTITALWCRGKYKTKDGHGNEIEKEWIPLIPRDKK